MNQQCTHTVLMIKPSVFGNNPETVSTNGFQTAGLVSEKETVEKARAEFNQLVATLRQADIRVIECDYDHNINTPDRIYPNNWILFDASGQAVLFPMFAPNRRVERQPQIIETVKSEGFTIKSVFDMSHLEGNHLYLEGTGSLVLDRSHRIAYASISPRTSPEAVSMFCKQFNYTPCLFQSFHGSAPHRMAIYHTNVMMSVATHVAVLCADSIDNITDRNAVIQSLEKSGKEIIYITETQLENFAGNMLELKNKHGKHFMVMSTRAYQSLNPIQVANISAYAAILHTDLSVIEQAGGGSARCMLAEVFLPAVVSP